MDNKSYQSRLQNPHSGIWDTLSLISILLCLVIFLLQWQQLPFFLDMYYHLGVAKGFQAAGGIVGHNFWEYGPGGAPHLYPPLLHLLMLAFLKTGLDEITMLRLFSLFMPGSLLFSLWYVIKNILTPRTAFFVIFLSLCSSVFMVSASFTPAATMGMLLMLLGVYSIYQNRILSSILIIAMIFYLHIGVAIIAILFLILARAFRIIETKAFLKIAVFSLLIGSPWFLHIIRNLSDISYQNTATMPLRFYPVILIFFITGIYLSLKKIRKYGMLLVLFLSLTPISLFYPFRFFSGQGLVGFLIFSGIGLERFYSAIDENLRRIKTAKKYTLFFLVILLLYLIFFSPSIHVNKKGLNLNLSDSLLTAISEGKEANPSQVLSTGIFNRTFFNSLADYVKSHSERGEFIWSNYHYIGGILWALTERPCLSYMLGEIQPKTALSNINQAALLIIIDQPRGQLLEITGRIKDRFEIKEFEKESYPDIYILINKNPSMVARFKVPEPFISASLAYLLLAVYFLVFFGDTYLIKFKFGNIQKFN